MGSLPLAQLPRTVYSVTYIICRTPSKNTLRAFRIPTCTSQTYIDDVTPLTCFFKIAHAHSARVARMVCGISPYFSGAEWYETTFSLCSWPPSLPCWFIFLSSLLLVHISSLLAAGVFAPAYCHSQLSFFNGVHPGLSRSEFTEFLGVFPIDSLIKSLRASLFKDACDLGLIPDGLSGLPLVDRRDSALRPVSKVLSDNIWLIV